MLSDAKVYGQTWLQVLKHEYPQKLASLSASGMLDAELARVEREAQAILDCSLPKRRFSNRKEAQVALQDWTAAHCLIVAAIARLQI